MPREPEAWENISPFHITSSFPLQIKTNNIVTGLSKESCSTITGTKRIPKEEEKEEEEEQKEEQEEERKKREEEGKGE